MPLRYNWLAASGNITGVTAGTTVGMTAVNMGDNTRQKIKYLSALVNVTADTNTLTFAFKWQVSNDNSTWVDLANGSQNAAAVTLATGTGSADTVTTKAFPLPEAGYGWRYVRAALVTGVTTGATIDLYNVSYCARTA